MTDGGYVYCFSNSSMLGILKIGMTMKTPELRLRDANKSNIWKPPTPYKIEFAKKVFKPKQKEMTLHSLLSQYTERINPKREFFRVSPEEVKTFFDLIDGEEWIDIPLNDDAEEEEEEEVESDIPNDVEIVKNGCRDMTKCFTNGQRIRHKIGILKIWIGTYDTLQNMILHNQKSYKSLSGFAGMHYITDRPDRVSANGWAECECEVDGIWISTFNL
jgi:hypothetical protein